jgi:hypothetical protein
MQGSIISDEISGKQKNYETDWDGAEGSDRYSAQQRQMQYNIWARYMCVRGVERIAMCVDDVWGGAETDRNKGAGRAGARVSRGSDEETKGVSGEV